MALPADAGRQAVAGSARLWRGQKAVKRASDLSNASVVAGSQSQVWRRQEESRRLQSRLIQHGRCPLTPSPVGEKPGMLQPAVKTETQEEKNTSKNGVDECDYGYLTVHLC